MPQIASRIGTEIKVTGSYSGATTARLGEDEGRIVRKFISINMSPGGSRWFALFRDCTADRGVLGWPVFNRSLRAIGYLGDARTIQSQESINPTQCCLEEEEAALYIRRFVVEEKQSKPYRELSNYRGLVQKAETLLTEHAFLHCLTHG